MNPARRPLPHVHGTAALIRDVAEELPSVGGADLGPLVERVGDSSLVLLGEATHGTAEFYAMRDRITRELITRAGFTVVAVEADGPDALQIDRHIRSRRVELGTRETPFARFPTWMWRNREFATFVSWLADHNASVRGTGAEVSFHGLDLYAMYSARAEVLAYLDRVDPDAAATARRRYSCLSPWQTDPAGYGHEVVSGRFAGCRPAVVATLTDLLRRRLDYPADDDYFDATQNAALIADAEEYYRVMYAGSTASWNLRDRHMFETLQALRAARGPDAKIVVWEHNSHVGDAGATEMGARGEVNVGMLCRRHYGDDAFLVGFGTDHGTVAAATDWGGPMHIKAVRPSHPQSYERLFHETELPAFFLHLREPSRPEVRTELTTARLERAIGVIYRPETERQSHYFAASLPEQFDEYVWMDTTNAVHPLTGPLQYGTPDLFPFGL